MTPECAWIAARVTEFWKSVTVGRPDECWPWTGYQEDGYGRFFFNGRMFNAHELALTFTTGEVRIADLDTCHGCGNSICCNPGHLRFDTRRSNVADTIRMGRNYSPPRKLSDSDILTIRARIGAGAKQQALADQYGVSESLISMIKTGRKYADV